MISAGCITLSEHLEINQLQTAGNYGTKYLAGFVASAANSNTICRIDLNLSTSAPSVSGNITLEIWSWDAGTGFPGAKITASNPVDNTDLPLVGSEAWIRFNGLSWNKSSGTSYVFVLNTTGLSSGDVKFTTGNIGDDGHHTVWSSSDGTTWTPHDIVNLDRVWFREYKQ